MIHGLIIYFLTDADGYLNGPGRIYLNAVLQQMDNDPSQSPHITHMPVAPAIPPFKDTEAAMLLYTRAQYHADSLFHRLCTSKLTPYVLNGPVYSVGASSGERMSIHFMRYFLRCFPHCATRPSPSTKSLQQLTPAQFFFLTHNAGSCLKRQPENLMILQYRPSRTSLSCIPTFWSRRTRNLFVQKASRC